MSKKMVGLMAVTAVAVVAAIAVKKLCAEEELYYDGQEEYPFDDDAPKGE